MQTPKGNVVKNYVFRGRQVYIMEFDNDGDVFYSFKIVDKSQRKEVYSPEFNGFTECDRASWKVVKAI